MHKTIVIGSGCAGLTAAIYLARAGLEPLVLEGMEPGGQLTLTSIIENFPGFPEGIEALDLVDNMKNQAKRFGATFQSHVVTRLERGDGSFALTLDDGRAEETRTAVIASGARARYLGIEGERELTGKGLSTCATCDGAFFRGKQVGVVGGGDSAMEEAIFLTRFAAKVRVIHRREELRASKILQQRAFENDKIEFLWNTQVRALERGASGLTGVTLADTKTGAERSVALDGLFLAIGHIPNTDFLGDLVPLDEERYIKATGVKTGVPGLYVAGDVADRHYQQAVTAAGTGCAAALEAEAYLAEHRLG